MAPDTHALYDVIISEQVLGFLAAPKGDGDVVSSPMEDKIAAVMARRRHNGTRHFVAHGYTKLDSGTFVEMGRGRPFLRKLQRVTKGTFTSIGSTSASMQTILANFVWFAPLFVNAKNIN